MNTSKLDRGSLSRWVVACVALAGCVAADPHHGVTEDGEASPAPPATPPPLSLAKSEVVTKLGELVPRWMDAELLRQPEARPVARALQQPLEVAKAFTSEALSSARPRPNGGSLFSSADGRTRLLVARASGAWSLMRPQTLRAGSEPFTHARASEVGERIAQALEVPEAERGRTIITDLNGRLPDGTTQRLGVHVRMHRKVNGLRVRGSVTMMTFDLDGVPFHIERKWPDFTLAEATSLVERDDILDTLSDDVAERLAKGNVGDIKSGLDYYPLGDGTFAPVVSLWIFAADLQGSPDAYQYSLITGEAFTPVGASPAPGENTSSEDATLPGAQGVTRAQ